MNGFYSLTIFLKKPIIDASYGPKYALREIISLERFDLVKTNFTKSVFDPSKPPPAILRKKASLGEKELYIIKQGSSVLEGITTKSILLKRGA